MEQYVNDDSKPISMEPNLDQKTPPTDPTIIIHLDQEGMIFFVNLELTYRFQTSANQTGPLLYQDQKNRTIRRGDSIYDHIPDEHKGVFIRNMENLAPLDPVFQFSIPVVIQDGWTHQMKWIIQGIFDTTGSLKEIHIHGLYKHIHSQSFPTEIHGKVTEIQDYLGVGTWEWDFLTDEFQYSEKTRNLFGLQKSGNSFLDVLSTIHPDDVSRIKAIIQKSMDQREEFDLECRISLPEDYTHFVRLYGGFLPDELNLPSRMIGSVEDITDRKLLENSLEMYRSLVHQSPISVMIVDPHSFQFLDINHTACDMLGYQYEELYRKDLKQILSPSDDSSNIQMLIEGLKMVHSITLETELEGKKRRPFPAELVAGYFYLGKEPYLVLFATDITERKKIERTIHRAREEAERANITKDRFVSLVAHDLKNPLSGNLGIFDMILEDENLNLGNQYRAVFEQLREDNQLMLNLINEVLNINRLKTGKIQLNKSFFEPAEVVSSVLRSLKSVIQKKSANIEVQISPDLLFFGDHKLFREVVINLVSNAIKFIHPGGTVRIQCEENSPGSLSIIDNGTGIPEKIINRLFLHEEKTSTVGTGGERGTGFGLPLSMDIMKAHEGTIRVQSKENEGSTFTLLLPFVRPTILIVEDEDKIRTTLARNLKRFAFHILEASDGKTAINTLGNETVHLILLDPGLPDLNGFDILKLIESRELTKQTAVIVITGDTGMETREKSLRMGAVDFVPKPTWMDDLIPRIRHALRGLQVEQ